MRAKMRMYATCSDKDGLSRAYMPAIRLGGWEGPIEILTPDDAAHGLEDAVGLLLTGGDDIHPNHWDASEPVHPSASVDEKRDSLEIPLARKAWERGLPIFGICRGHQILNVALGGSLFQDIPSAFGCGLDAHRYGDSFVPSLRHYVRVDIESRLGEIVGQPQVHVNSRHHQAIARPAPSLKIVGWDDETQLDGVPLIEAVESDDPKRWVVGVQWHPENLVGLEGEGGRAARDMFRAFASELNTNLSKKQRGIQ
jgi:putative glutamine amidotransferase